MLSSWSRLIWTLSDLNHCSSEVCDGGVKSQRSKLGMDQEDIATPTTNHANIVQDNDEVEEVVEYWVLMNYTVDCCWWSIKYCTRWWFCWWSWKIVGCWTVLLWVSMKELFVRVFNVSGNCEKFNWAVLSRSQQKVLWLVETWDLRPQHAGVILTNQKLSQVSCPCIIMKLKSKIPYF